MPAHRVKRQFAGDASQRQITSFFSPLSAAEAKSVAAAATTIPHPLPEHVQSGLVNVGMRVRKSVPEGYKTGSYRKHLDAAASHHYPSSPLSSSVKATPPPVVMSSTSATFSTSTTPTAGRELVPFCGLHKVGGLAAQQSCNSAGPIGSVGPFPVPGLDDLPGLTLSQESVDSEPTSSFDSARAARKRFFPNDEADDDVFDDDADGEGEGGDRVVDIYYADKDATRPRVIAKTRARRKEGLSYMAVEDGTMAVDTDFEDAAFLDYHTALSAANGMDMSDA